MYSYRKPLTFYTYKKNFGLSSVDFPMILYSYPSYLGVDILTASDSDMPHSLLGFTNGRAIVIKEGLKDVEDFVLLHEEEHVKNMDASELEVDKRALRRLIARNTSDEKLEKILQLLEKRWNIKIPSPDEFLQ